MPWTNCSELRIAGSEVERFLEHSKRFVDVSLLGEQQSQLTESFKNSRIAPDFQAPPGDLVILAGLIFAFKACVVRQRAL